MILFSKDVFLRIDSYLATKFEFEKDKNCLVQDFLIPHTQKNPLLNLDKFSTNISTIIVGSTKQYLRILPYKQYNQYRIGCLLELYLKWIINKLYLVVLI